MFYYKYNVTFDDLGNLLYPLDILKVSNYHINKQLTQCIFSLDEKIDITDIENITCEEFENIKDEMLGSQHNYEPEIIEEVEVDEEKVAMAEAIIQLENKIQELEQKLGGN
ncbi:hypothetical protein CLPU_41c00020 [Gottschalkia purinilytica]|uniref:Uncharacterized protein n=1 Tax=Gottschalkia purinilytica TaxID=1503 RepID=A0A0L0W657_GOTPU|nr:hypothetical protein [Gottschalkia purinilytica]KNF06966.1 hypothetical protein CLPU_41c00020 [Gottschalkia purinilytica]